MDAVLPEVSTNLLLTFTGTGSDFTFEVTSL